MAECRGRKSHTCGTLFEPSRASVEETPTPVGRERVWRVISGKFSHPGAARLSPHTMYKQVLVGLAPWGEGGCLCPRG